MRCRSGKARWKTKKNSSLNFVKKKFASNFAEKNLPRIRQKEIDDTVWYRRAALRWL